MSAEGNGAPLTAGQLRAQLGLSSGGASLVIDRLEQAGHIRRARDHPTDNRVVHLRYTDQGRATGLAFFGSLGERANAVLDQFGDDELAVIERFITAMADSMHEHVVELDHGPGPGWPDASNRERQISRGTEKPIASPLDGDSEAGRCRAGSLQHRIAAYSSGESRDQRGADKGETCGIQEAGGGSGDRRAAAGAAAGTASAATRGPQPARAAARSADRRADDGDDRPGIAARAPEDDIVPIATLPGTEGAG